jgi:hypothetical protein
MSEPPANEEIRALVALEAGALVDPGLARAHLAARLTAQLQPPDVSSAPAGSGQLPRARVWRLLGLATVGAFGAGVATGSALRGPSPAPAPTVEIRYVDRIVPGPPDAGVAPLISSSPPEVPPSAPTRPSLPPMARTTTVGSDEALARERRVIDQARSAIARRDADAALKAIDEHAKVFPHGQLVEMREALSVQALVYAGRDTEARSRAERFHARFPGSTYASIVDAAIASIP